VKSLLDRLADSLGLADGIPEAELERLSGRAIPRELAKGDYFLRAGEVPDRVGLLRSGLLRLFCLDCEGKEYTKHFVTEGTLAISYSAFLLGEPSRFSIQALEDASLLVVDRATYRELLSGHPCWQAAARKLAEMLFISLEKRGLELLSLDAEERYRIFREDFPGLEGRISQYFIASYLGISPESLSRIRRIRGAS
jgi:CRP-like cAMP-binding protein